MVQRKMPSKVPIQAGNVRADNLKLSSSRRREDGKGRGADRKVLGSSPSKGSSCQPEMQKQKSLMITTGRSPSYMKPTSSTNTKKDRLSESIKNSLSDLGCKNQPPNISSNQEVSSVSSKKLVKSSTRSSTSKSLRTLTTNPISKPSRACPRKSSRVVAPSADMNSQRATCSSTLKDSEFSAYHMLNHGGTEGTTIMEVCPYTFCSLNDHYHAGRRVSKTQKTMNQEALSLPRLKDPTETKGSHFEQNVIDRKPGCKDEDTGIFNEVYSKEDEANPTGVGHGDEMGKLENSQELQSQEDIKSTVEDNVTAAGEDIMKQAMACKFYEPPVCRNNFDEDFKSCFNAIVIKAGSIRSFLQEQNEGFCSRGKMKMGSSSSEITNVKEQSNSNEALENQDTGYIPNGINHDHCSSMEEVFQDLTNTEANDDKNKTFVNDEITCVKRVLYETLGDRQKHASPKDGTCMPLGDQIYDNSEDQCALNQVKSEGSKILEIKSTEKYQDAAKLLVESNGNESLGHKGSEPHKIDVTDEERNSSPESNDECNIQVTQNQSTHAHNEKISAAQDQELLEKHEDSKLQQTSCTGDEDHKTSTNYKGTTSHKMPVKDGEEQRKFNWQEPNFLPSIPDRKQEKVFLKHQNVDKRKTSEEWMLDYALRQAVTKLAPVRKGKVALLVEAFEAVMPVPVIQA